MKTLFTTMLLLASLSNLKAGDKEPFKTYYFYSSTCYYTCVVDRSAILTLFKDNSFSFEIYNNQYSDSSTYTRSVYDGIWKKNEANNIELIYNADFAKDKPQNFGLTYLPYHCISESETLVTDSKSFPKLFSERGKNIVLGEKWRYEQFSPKTKPLIKFKGTVVSITNNLH